MQASHVLRLHRTPTEGSENCCDNLTDFRSAEGGLEARRSSQDFPVENQSVGLPAQTLSRKVAHSELPPEAPRSQEKTSSGVRMSPCSGCVICGLEQRVAADFLSVRLLSYRIFWLLDTLPVTRDSSCCGPPPAQGLQGLRAQSGMSACTVLPHLLRGAKPAEDDEEDDEAARNRFWQTGSRTPACSARE